MHLQQSGPTRFTFSDALIAELAGVSGIAAIKMPLLAGDDYAGELARLRAVTPDRLSIGHSGDWGAAPALLAGSDAWYSVVAGLLPEPAIRLARAAQAGRKDDVAALDAAFAPLWTLFKAHGSLRVMYAIANRLALSAGDPPLPLMRPEASIYAAVKTALERLHTSR